MYGIGVIVKHSLMANGIWLKAAGMQYLCFDINTLLDVIWEFFQAKRKLCHK